MNNRTDNSTLVDDYGWQITDMERDLYPGGPWALRITSPDYPEFYTGWRYAYTPEIARDEGRYLIISHIGGRYAGIANSRRLFSHNELNIVQERLSSYINQHWVAVTGKTITHIEFRAEDMQVEIF